MTKIENNTNNAVQLNICHNNLVELSKYANGWDRLQVESLQHSPMLSYAWVSSFLEHRLENDESWYVVLAHSMDRLIGVLPIIITPHRVAGLSRPVLHSPNDSHTLGGDILIATDAPDNLINLIIKTAEQEVPHRFVLTLYRVAENSRTLKASLTGTDRLVYQESAGIGYYFPTEGEFDKYYSQLSNKFRGNLRRSENQLEKLTKINPFIQENKAATEHNLDRFMLLEASGWKGREGSAIKCSPKLQSFYTTLVQRLSKSNFLRWEYIEDDDGLCLAFNLSARIGSTAIIWKLGYDENYSRYSPGGLLFKHVLENAFDGNEIKEFNLLTDTDWQTKWNPKHYKYFNQHLYPLHPLSFVFGYLPFQTKTFIRNTPILYDFMHRAKNFTAAILTKIKACLIGNKLNIT